MSHRQRKGKTAGFLIMSFLLVVGMLFFSYQNTGKAGAKTKKMKAADLRIIFTTDLHGQVNTIDYSTGSSYEKGSLAKAFTLIEEARAEVNKNNYLTFDLGDVLYSYSTDYIMGKDEDAIQPIYKAMATVGYDAITIGNHDLDFGLSYIKKQLKGSKLDKICVSSNVHDVNTKDSIWNNTMMLNKKVTASDGTTVNLKIGLIGEVVPVLSSKTEDYTGVLSSEDIVENARKEAANLKAQGADLVVVLSHSGMGDAVPEPMAKNASYAVSQLEDVDVVLCGHEHNAFPSEEDASKAYYNLPGVNKTTGLANNKVIAMSKNVGQSIGVVDLSLKISDSGVAVSKRSADIRLVDAKKTAANEKINNDFMGEWHDKLMKLITDDTTVATFTDEASVNNYFGILNDTDAIQLINNAKLAYGMQFVHEKLPDYENYPIIAATKYSSYGEIDGTDYMDIKGVVKGSQMNQLHTYTQYVGIYEISGKQLREWLEWSASAYHTASSEDEIEDDMLKFYGEQHNMKLAVNEKWINDWRNFYIFDGIEYEMDATVPPRYSIDGELINDTHRITKMTRNGQEIQDGQKFVLVGNHMSGISGPSKEVVSQKLKATGYKRVQVILKNYLQNLAKEGSIGSVADDNWSVKFEEGKEYLFKSGIGANEDAIKKDYRLIGSDGSYNYYVMRYNQKEDKKGPNIVLSALTTETTNNDVQVRVEANDKSGIEKLLYAVGKRELDDPCWQVLDSFGDTFTANTNSVYTVYAMDKCGNASIAYITIGNINRSVLQAPKLKKFTNRMAYVKGSGEPSATVYVRMGDKEFHSKIDAKGNFECPVETLKAGESFTVFVKDDQGRESEVVSATTKRNGPNQPSYEQLSNRDMKIVGTTNDNHVGVFAIIDGKVYVSRDGGVEAWKKCKGYNKNKEVVETRVDISDGDFRIEIPEPYADKKAQVYTVDAIGRISRVMSQKVLDVAPNKPIIYQVSNVEKAIYGEIPEYKPEVTYTLHVTRNGEEFDAPVENGRFKYEFSDWISLDDDIRITVGDTGINGAERISAVNVPVINDIEELVTQEENDELVISESNNKTSLIRGTYSDQEEDIYVKVGKDSYKIQADEDGKFKIDCGDNLTANTVVYAVARSSNSDIFGAAKMTVVASVPLKPVMDIEEIPNSATKVKVYGDEDCTMKVRFGDVVYTAQADHFDPDRDLFVYHVNIDKTQSGQEAKVYAVNQVGHSRVLRMNVAEIAPDAPKVDTITDGARKITGTIHIIGNPEPAVETTEETGDETEAAAGQPGDVVDENATDQSVTDEDVTEPEVAEPQEPTVENTGTRVYARVGGKTYEGVVRNNGKFTILLEDGNYPKAGRIVKVWGYNKAGGYGPKAEITVKKAVKVEKNKKK